MPERASRRVILVVTSVAAAAVAAGYYAVVRPGVPEAAPAPAAAPAKEGAVVVYADEGVQRTVPGGGWAPARAGDALAVADSIRTGARSTAELALGRGSRVTVSQRTEVTVRELTAAVQRVGLVRGRIGVDVEADGTRVLRVEDASGAMHVSASAGRFGIVAAPSSLAVVAQEGGAVLESAGQAVDVAAGQQAIAWRGHPPLSSAPVPRGLLLRAVQAVEARRASACAVVEVDVAAEVLVDGEAVETPHDGRLVIRLPPRSRRRTAELVVRHANGELQRSVVPCWRDEADVSDLEVRWDGR